jgi:hypothetical protein
MFYDCANIEFADYVQVIVLLDPCFQLPLFHQIVKSSIGLTLLFRWARSMYLCCSNGQECLLLRKTYDLNARVRHVSHKNSHLTICDFVSYYSKRFERVVHCSINETIFEYRSYKG